MPNLRLAKERATKPLIETLSIEEQILWFAKNTAAGILLRCNAFITVMQAAELRDLDNPSVA